MGASQCSKESYVPPHSSANERSFFVWFAPLKRRCAAVEQESGCRSKNSNALTPMALPVEKSLYLHRSSHRSTQRTRQRTHKKNHRQNGILFSIISKTGRQILLKLATVSHGSPGEVLAKFGGDPTEGSGGRSILRCASLGFPLNKQLPDVGRVVGPTPTRAGRSRPLPEQARRGNKHK